MRAIPFAFILFMLCACNSKATTEAQMLEIPKSPGQVLNPDSVFVKQWPGKPGLFKVKDELILAIPPQYQGFWLQRHWLTGMDRVTRPPAPLDKLPQTIASFSFHMPDFSGFTIENYEIQFDENLVTVSWIETAPMSYHELGAPGFYPPNVIKRILDGNRIDPNAVENKFDLKCYPRRDTEDNQQYCYGQRTSDIDEYLILDIRVEPYPDWVRFPLMRTKYFSPKYGGLEISWQAHVKYLPHWREIDAEIWKNIARWNIAPRDQSTLKPTTAPVVNK